MESLTTLLQESSVSMSTIKWKHLRVCFTYIFMIYRFISKHSSKLCLDSLMRYGSLWSNTAHQTALYDGIVYKHCLLEMLHVLTSLMRNLCPPAYIAINQPINGNGLQTRGRFAWALLGKVSALLLENTVHQENNSRSTFKRPIRDLFLAILTCIHRFLSEKLLKHY